MQFSKKWLKSVTTLNPYYSQLLSPWPWTALAIGRELRSIDPLGSELWPLIEGTHQICLKLGAKTSPRKRIQVN